MKILLLYEYPPLPAGLATQGDLLYRGLRELGIETQAAHWESAQEKEWHYRWFAPDVVIGVGYWGYTRDIVLHPQQFGMRAVPWLVADGYIANFREVLNALPLILVTSNWVKQVYARDGIRPDNIAVLPVGCDTQSFIPRDPGDPRVAAIRDELGIAPHELMILTVGGDAASKGGQEVMRALAQLGDDVPPWKYVCKVWPQPRTEMQTYEDMRLARQLGIEDRIIYRTSRVSRAYMPFLIAACDIYAGPSRLEGFGMPHVEAGACGKPVIAIDAMAFRDTLVQGETALLAGVARENVITETILGEAAGFQAGQRVIFDPPRVADYRANVPDIAHALRQLLCDPALRQRMGEAGRRRVTRLFDHQVVARQCVDLLARHYDPSWSTGEPTRETRVNADLVSAQ